MKLFVLIILYLISNINCIRLEITDITFDGIYLSPPQHNKNPITLSGESCTFYLIFLVVDIDGQINSGDEITLSTPFQEGSFTPMLSNKTAMISQYEVTTSIHPITTTVQVVASAISFNKTTQVVLNCYENDINKTTFNVLKNSINFSPIFQFPALIKLEGTFYNSIYSLSTFTVSYGYNCFLVLTPQTDIMDSFNISLQFLDSNVKNVTIPPLYQYNVNNDIVFIKYPNQSEFNEMGRGYTPLYTISSSGEMPIYKTNSMSSVNPRAIYGSPHNYTFLGSVAEGDSNSGLNITTLNGNIFEQITSNFKTNINSIPLYKLPSIFNSFNFGNVSSSSQMFTAYFNSVVKYDFSPLIYSIKEYTLKLPWPFGFQSGNNLGNSIIVSFPFSNFSTIPNDRFMVSSIGISRTIAYFPVNLVNLNNNIDIKSIEIIYLYDFNLLVKVKINSNVSYDYQEFSFIEILGEKFGYENCVSDEEQNPSFEFVVNAWEQFNYITIGDLSGYRKTFEMGSFFDINPPRRLMQPLIMMENDIFSIQNITFLYNNLNVIDQNVSNIMTFNYSDVLDTKKPFALYILDEASGNLNYLDQKSLFFSKWNSGKRMFEIEFFIKANIREGAVPWMLLTGNKFAGLIHSFLPNSSQLFIKKTKFDAYGPIFTSINKNISSSAGSNLIVDWEFHIRDEGNGFERGYIEIRGEFDSSLYTFTFTKSNLKQGDIYNGVYIYSQPISFDKRCNIQNYTITNVELYDRFGNLAKFKTMSEDREADPTKNPFILFGDDPNINRYQIDCIQTLDANPPNLISFTFENKIETSQLLSFTFSADCPESGIKLNQYPIVYASTKQLKTIQCISTIKNYNGTYALYSCDMKIPPGFAYKNDLFFSVYGFINNGGYYSGFSTDYLKSNSFPYFISNIPIYRKLLISNTSTITNKGGDLWIIGKEFDSNNWVYVEYRDGKPNDSLFPNEIHSSAMLIQNIKPTNLHFLIQIRHITNGTISSNYYQVEPLNFIYPTDSSSGSSSSNSSSSNSLPSSESSESSESSDVNPTSLPTNSPQKCKGNPICGGSNGICSLTGCVCHSPWVGDDCLSKVIIVPQPSINTSQPSTEIPIIDENDSESILFRSLISIISLRELDFNEKQVNQFIFDKWIYSPLNETTNQYFTNITIQPSASNNYKGGTTSITVILQWFNNQTNITFANEQLQMKPSSIKYTIQISEYNFSNRLNKLQLVMSASLTSLKGNDNICSFHKFGETNGDDSEYIKIQVNDHSLYGRFIKRAIIDSKIRSISNVQLNSSLGISSSSSSSLSQQIYIGIDIPMYNNYVLIDPDFSLLIDSKPASSDDNNSICSSSKSKLSKTQLAGIIIGSVVFGSIVIIAITYHILKKRKDAEMVNKMQNKLKKINE
ncbi:hypothetical protein ACTA71_004933 [Dictyostelium dimigraforme]